MDLAITSLTDDPALWEVESELDGLWPRFMSQDPTGIFYYGYQRQHFAAHCLVAIDRSTGKAVAKAHSVPLAHDFSPSESLPEGGWDWAIRKSVHDRLTGDVPTIACALEIMIRTREDGLPVDPWLRVHVRAGGRIVNVAHSSMVMTGRLAEWREWTGLPFDTDGPVEVPTALASVQVSLAEDIAVYVEPNVWVHHRL